MPDRFDLIVFDWDGTLVDSSRMIVDSVQAASVDAGLPVPDEVASRNIIGLSLPMAIKTLFPEITASQLQMVVARYGYHFHLREHEISLFDGVIRTLTMLGVKGHLMAVATGKGRRGLDHAFATSGLSQHFAASRCADECNSKPHPQMLEELMDELGVAPERTLMVGDTRHDMEMARNAGIAGVGVTFGAQTRNDLLPYHPIAIFDEFTALCAWLDQNA